MKVYLIINITKSDKDGEYGGEMFIGGSNPNFYHGELHYVNIFQDSHWVFLLDR